MFTVLFVCTGNTCRSPMAERLLLKLARDNGVTAGLQVVSAGVFAYDGETMSLNAETVLRKYGVNIGDFCANRLRQEHVENADLILGMTDAHVSAILDFFPQAADKTFTVGAFCEQVKTVPDPFGQGLNEYEKCFLLLEEMLKIALPKINSLVKEDRDK